MAEDYKLQVSYKIPGDAMINIRANTADELSVLLEGIGDFATQISAVQKLVMGAATTVPFIDIEYHSKHRASALLSTTPGNASVRWSRSNLPARAEKVQVGNLQQDGKSILDVGLSDAPGRGPMQASKLVDEQFPF